MEKVKDLMLFVVLGLFNGIRKSLCLHENKHLRDENYNEKSLPNGLKARTKVNTYYCGDCKTTMKEKIDLGVV